jgi:hypothetical protein
MTHEMEATTLVEAPALTRQQDKGIVGLSSWLMLLACVFYVRPTLSAISGNFLDDHWAAFLDLAFLAHKQFGTEVIFTYGPWGFLDHPRSIEGIYGWVVFGRAILAAGCAVGLATLAGRWIGRRSLQVLWASTILIFAEPIYLLTPLLCLLVWREPSVRKKGDLVALHMVAFAAGLAAQTKFTCFVLLALLAPALLLRRPTRWLAVTASGSWLFFWLLAGQSLSGIPAFLWTSFEQGSTYNAAMAWVSEPMGRLAGFLLCGLAVVVCAVAEFRRPSLVSFALFCWIAMFEYIVLGQAIIRCDNGHIALGLIGIAFPFALALIACPHLWPAATRDDPLNRPLFVLVTLISLVLTYGIVGGAVWVLEPSYRPPFVEALYRIQKAVQMRNTALTASVASLPSSGLLTADANAGIGVLPDRLGYAFTKRLPLHTIPTVLSVMAWSPRLTAINANFLESGQAPGSIYLELDPIDRHYPALDDSLSWRSLLTHYQPSGNQDGFLILSRRPQPLRFTRKLAVVRNLALGASMEIPPTAGNMVWAEIDAHHNWRGKLKALSMNSQKLFLDIETPQGRQEFFFLDANATCGFMLSPYIASTDVMKSLYTSGGPVDSPQRVERFTLRGTPDAMESFDEAVQVRLYSVSIQ